MNKIEIGLLILTVGIVLYIGGIVYFEMAVELETHPEITDIGSPPVFTDLRLVAVTVLGAVVVCGLALKFCKPEDNKRDDI